MIKESGKVSWKKNISVISYGTIGKKNNLEIPNSILNLTCLFVLKTNKKKNYKITSDRPNGILKILRPDIRNRLL